jgi:hypothetical protein
MRTKTKNTIKDAIRQENTLLYYTNSIGQNPHSESNNCSGTNKSPKEPKLSLVCPHEPTTGSCPEQNESRPHPRPYFFQIHFNITLSSMPVFLQPLNKFESMY